MNAKGKEDLGKYFAPLYLGIYRIRLLIEMHSNIANVSDQLCNQNFWGYLQNNIIIGAVIIELFSILKNSPVQKSILNKITKKEKSEFLKILKTLRESVENLETIRTALAHKDKDNCHGDIVDYNTILTLLDKFENELDNVICGRYQDYYLVSTQELNIKNLIGPTIIRQTSFSKNKYYYCEETNHGFIIIKNKELYDEIEFPDTNRLKKITSSSLPKKTLIDINKIRLDYSWSKPQTKPNKENSPTTDELGKILAMEIGIK